jgi:hypothetical protein
MNKMLSILALLFLASTAIAVDSEEALEDPELQAGAL